MSIGQIASVTNTGITSAREYIDAKASAIIPPKSARGISGWQFDIVTRESLELSAEITDHTVQSGSFISDHVVERPVRITLSGLIGELVSLGGGINGTLQELQNKLEVVDAYGGDYTAGMTQRLQNATSQAQNAVSQINQAIDKTQNLISAFDGDEFTLTRQQQAYIELRASFKTRQIVTVDTPWEYFQSMVIETISVIQDEITDEITDISVTLKEVRFAELEFVNFDETLFPPAVDVQSTEEQDAGIVKGQRDSFAFSLSEAAGN